MKKPNILTITRDMFAGNIKDVVLSEKELSVALDHLHKLPHSTRRNLPESWSRQRLLNDILMAIGNNPKVGKTYDIAPSLYGLVKHFGTDFLAAPNNDHRLQVWLLIRPESDPNNLVILNSETN